MSLEVGNVVKLKSKQYAPAMTVIRKGKSNEVDCSWFNANFCVCESTFPESALELVPDADLQSLL